MLHQRNAEATFDQQAVGVLHVRNIHEIRKPPALIDHRQIHAVFSDAQSHFHPATVRNALIGLDRIRHSFRRHPPKIIEPITIENLCRGCGCCDNHPNDGDEIGSSGNVDVDDMEWPAGRGAHRGAKLAHSRSNVRERVNARRRDPLAFPPTQLTLATRLLAVDSVWEQWDLVCADPVGCDELDQLIRALIWGYVVIAWMIFFAALRPWTTDLPKPVGIVLAAAASALIVWISIGVVGSSGNLRTAGIISAIGLLAVWIGRPSFTERKPKSEPDINEEASPSSSTH